MDLLRGTQLNSWRVQAQGTTDGLVVLCHGYGAPGNDLVGLAEGLRHAQPALQRCVFAFPEGPLDLGFGRAWWEINFSILQRAHAGDESARAQLRQARDQSSRKKLATTIAELGHATGLPLSKTIIGGFSQGSMVSLDCAFNTLEEPAAGLVLLSGAPMGKDAWESKLVSRSKLAVFQSHGQSDAVLPIGEGRALHLLMKQFERPTEYLEFHGGHGIPEAITDKLAIWLVERLQIKS